jgi:hypothetical protein
MDRSALITLCLKFLAGLVMLSMLFSLVLLHLFPADTFGMLLIGAFGALGGHAASSQGAQP